MGGASGKQKPNKMGGENRRRVGGKAEQSQEGRRSQKKLRNRNRSQSMEGKTGANAGNQEGASAETCGGASGASSRLKGRGESWNWGEGQQSGGAENESINQRQKGKQEESPMIPLMFPTSTYYFTYKHSD